MSGQKFNMILFKTKIRAAKQNIETINEKTAQTESGQFCIMLYRCRRNS